MRHPAAISGNALDLCGGTLLKAGQDSAAWRGAFSLRGWPAPEAFRALQPPGPI